MYKRNFSKLSITLFLSVIFTFCTGTFSNASYINPHGYAVQYVNGGGLGVTGGYFETPHGQEYLYSNWSQSHNLSFITNEMWMDFVSGYEWIETGAVDGSVNGSYWAGDYFALQYFDVGLGQYVYTEYTIGSMYGQGLRRYQIQNIGNFTWRVYLNGTAVANINGYIYASSEYQTVGIETNDSENLFSHPNYDQYIQYRTLGGLWRMWASGEPVRLNENNLGWTSTFSGHGARVTFIY